MRYYLKQQTLLFCMYCHKFYVRTVKVKMCNMTPDFRLPLPRFSAPASSLPKSLLSGGCGGRVCANLSILDFLKTPTLICSPWHPFAGLERRALLWRIRHIPISHKIEEICSDLSAARNIYDNKFRSSWMPRSCSLRWEGVVATMSSLRLTWGWCWTRMP